MPIFKDDKGQMFAIPSKELEQYKVTPEEAARLVPQSGRDGDDVDLQRTSHPWYSGD